MEQIFDKAALRSLAAKYNTPLFVYSTNHLKERASVLMGTKFPFGFTPRYAVKANNYSDIIRIFEKAGLHFDTSSSYEAQELLDLAIPGSKISLSSQQPAHNLAELIAAEVQYIATSLHQLRLFIAAAAPGSSVGLRVNPGLGAGHNNRTTTGGANSSFGLWNAYLPDALQLAEAAGISITKLHVHIGSGADPKMWRTVMETALELVNDMPDVTSLNIGGGYKIHRFSDENETDMTQVLEIFGEQLRQYATLSGRQLHLEIEPGTWLVGHAGVLLSTVSDIVDTGADGHTFLRLDTGMNDIIRPSMYGAQHQIEVLSGNNETASYVVVGHNCETGDILTPAAGDPESIEPREMTKAEIGNVVAIYDTGAYCRSFAVKGYNSFPSAEEIMI
jgi:diaminopimelate decarboxylase